MELRLTAVVGYSRLMEQDEAGTFQRLRADRKEHFEPKIAAHHGRVCKLMGAGLLDEFASVVDAVECAIALQRGMAERNTAAPAEHRIEARIGINLGDVIVEKDDIGAIDMITPAPCNGAFVCIIGRICRPCTVKCPGQRPHCNTSRPARMTDGRKHDQ